MRTVNEINGATLGVLFDLVDRYGEDLKKDRAIDGAEAVDFLAQYLLPEALSILRHVAKIDVAECPWCSEDSWYGDDHTSYCPVAVARQRV